MRELPSVRSRATLSPGLSASNLTRTTKTLPEPHSLSTQRSPLESQLDDIDAQVRSRQRTLELLGGKLASETALIAQLEARDKQIEDLQNKLAEVSGQLAVSALESLSVKEKTIAGLQEEKMKLMRELQGQEEALAEKAKRISDLEQELISEKENTELVQEALSEECEALKSQAQIKDGHTKGIKQDILQLSKIVSDMSRLNSELNEKVLMLNGEIEKLNTRVYTAEAMAKHTEEIETGFAELKAQYEKLQKRNGKLGDEIARMKGLEDASHRCQEQLKMLEDFLAASPATQTHANSIREVRFELKKHTAVATIAEDSVPALKQKIRELEDSLRSQRFELQRLQTTASSATARVESLEKEKPFIKKQFEETIERLQQRNSATQDGFEKLQMKLDSLREEFVRKDSDLQKATVRAVSLESRLEIMKAELSKRDGDKNEALVHELKSQLLTIKGQRVTQESSIEAREKRLRQTAAKLKMMMDELWRKDTEILKLQTALKKVESGHKEESTVKSRLAAAETLSGINDEVEKRDAEITLLRDMLRSTQLQLRTKEAEAMRLKKKYENDPVREGHFMSSPPRDLSPERLAVKLDSDVRKFEDLSELRKSIRAGGNPEAAKSLLFLDEVPRDKGKTVEALTARMREVLDTLEKWANRKLPGSLPRSLFAGRYKSSLLSTLFRDRETLNTAELLQTLTAKVAEPAEIPAKRSVHAKH